MDHRMAAAGEREDPSQNPFISEMSKKLSESSRRYGHDLEYLEGALEWILNQTKAKLSNEDERLQHLLKLSTYPRAKLMMLSEFSGSYFPEVWGYLDTVRIPEVRYDRMALPAPSPDTRGLAADMEEHSRLVHSIEIDPTFPHSSDPKRYAKERALNVEKKHRIELESLARLHKKYPGAGFNKIKR